MPRITIYTQPGCHLCDDALEILEQARRHHRFELTEVDISADQRLHRAYLERIPVVEIDGEEAFEYFVDPAELSRRLDRVRAR